MKKLIISLIVLAVLGLGFYFIRSWYANRLYRDARFASGNGRIEATEINIAARLAGKVEMIKVLEGDKVKAGQVLVVMQTNVLVAELAQAEAKKEQALAAQASALAKIDVQEANLAKAKADLESAVAVEKNRYTDYKRYKELWSRKATSEQHYQRAETLWLSGKADTLARKAAVKEVEANLSVAKADAIGAKANILAAEAEMTRIKADIDDSILRAPLMGRIQYRVAEPGEVLSAGGRALNMVDLTDVYMTFFLPEEAAGKVRIGSEVRIILDAVRAYPLPAKVTYVASVAQFTPKTVETRVERQKLMFRVKAHINRELLERAIDIIKTGLPGEAWVKLDESAPWPKELEINPEGRKRVDYANAQLKAKGNAPGAVIRSETGKKAAVNQELKNKLTQKMQGVSREEALSIGVKAVKKYNDAKQVDVDKATAAAKKAAAAKDADASRSAEAAKKAADAARKATVTGDKK